MSILLVFLIASRFFDAKTALLASAIAACYPALVYYDNLILRESFTGFLLLCTFALTWVPSSPPSPRRFLGLGVLLAINSMCRPETLLLTAPVYLIATPHAIRPLKKHATHIVCIALPILLVWVPWTARNYVQFGSLSPVTSGLGSVIWFGNRWAAIGGDNHTETDRQNLKNITETIKAQSAESEIDKTFLQRSLGDLAQKPLWFAQMTYKKGILFWKDANGVKKTLPKIHPALPTLLNTYYYSLLILAVCAIIAYRRRKDVVALFGIVIFYMMIYALLHVRNRYRVPILPLVFILSSGGIQFIAKQLKRKWQTSRVLNQATMASSKEGATT